jgi:transposase
VTTNTTSTPKDVVAARRAYYAANRERILANRREHYRQNKERLLTYSRDYYQENKDKIRGKSKRWYEQNRERKSAYWKQYYQSHRTAVLMRNRERYLRRKSETQAAIETASPNGAVENTISSLN